MNFWLEEREKCQTIFNQNFDGTFVRHTCCPECWGESCNIKSAACYHLLPKLGQLPFIPKVS